ncbi:MAG: hypothetical protein HZB98_01885 [Bacteroidia bacterium]|nr:hypothetical protein [Bacteroidia bacterium]
MQNHQKIWIFLLILLIFKVFNNGSDALAQTDKQFSPHGNPMALIFTDVNYTFNKTGNSKAFEVTRAYLGYEYYLSQKFYSRITIDVGDPGAGGHQMAAFLKFAYLQYKSDKFSARFGMIPTCQFTLSENIWGYRYIAKSFQDAYRFGPSADLGASAEYSPSKFISFDLSLLNGEGFKKVQIDSSFKSTAGITIKPVEGLSLRAYYDYMNSEHSQRSASFFAGYSKKGFQAGIEYNLQTNNELKKDHDFSGFSIFSSFRMAEKFSVFARYDYLESVIPETASEPWNSMKDGQLFLAGFDYNPVKGVKIAPTFAQYYPYDESLNVSTRLGLYFELRF